MNWMKQHQRKIVGLAAIVLLYALSGGAQLQQSGGAGASMSITGAIPAGANVIGHVIADSGSTTAVTGNVAVTGSFWQATQPVSGTVSVSALPTGSNVIGTVNTIPKTACGNTVASQALAAVPQGATAVFASTTCVTAIILNNTTSGALTVTVTDNAGSPINDIVTFSIPAFSQLIQPLYGVQFTSGVKWNASGAGVTGAIIGFN